MAWSVAINLFVDNLITKPVRLGFARQWPDALAWKDVNMWMYKQLSAP